MKTAYKIIDTIEFGKCKQEIEVTFQYDKESIENIEVFTHNYDDGKHIVTRKVTTFYTPAMVDAMAQSVDIEQLRLDQLENS